MGIDRYNCICRPFKSFGWTPRDAMKGIYFSFALSALLSTPQLYVWKIDWSQVLKGDACIASFSSREIELAYIVYYANTQFLIPFYTLVHLYVRIFMIVSNRHKYIKKKVSQSTISNSFSLFTESVSRPSSVKSSNFRNFNQTFCCKKDERPNVLGSINQEIVLNRLLIVLSKKKIKTFKLTLTVVVGFALCTLPFFIVQITLATIGKPEAISNETLNKILRSFFLYIFYFQKYQ